MTPVAALVIPSPPMLLAEYVGLADPAAELRHRVTQALREAVDRHAIEHVVVVTGHERAPRHTKGPVGARVAHARQAGSRPRSSTRGQASGLP